MAFNASGAFSQALELFSSLFTDMNPGDLPSGLSPDNQDMFYFPGSVQTRPALNRLYANPPEPTSSEVSVSEFPNPAGNPQTISLYNSGNLWSNDEQTQTNIKLAAVTPGVQFKAESAFDKQWYAFFSGSLSSQFSENPFVGADVPRYYDGQNVWRVTQDAPGVPPTFTNVVQSAAVLNAVSAGSGVNIVSIRTSDPFTIYLPAINETITVYKSITIITVSPSGVTLDGSTKLTGLTGAFAYLNGIPQTVTNVESTTAFKIAANQTTFATLAGVGQVEELTGAPALQRTGCIVTATLASGNLPSRGWFVLIQDKSTPATDPIYQTIGGGNVSMTRDVNGYVTVVMTDPVLNLPPGTPVYLTGGDTHYPPSIQTVYEVISPTIFTVFWPGDGTLAASGSVGDTQIPWGGLFQVISVNSATKTFTYFQLGPDDSYTGGDTLQALPQSQVIPGPRTAFLMFLSANGALTAPSLPVQLSAQGGINYLFAQNIATGPPGTAQRIIAFTPAFGSFVYYITPSIIPQSSGNPPILSLGTIIDDNTTTSALLDFSDIQLIAATRIDNQDGNNPGNDLFGQVVLSPCLGVIEYQQRMIWWGQQNNIKNLINPGFDGGYVGTLSGTPPGWGTSGSTNPGSLVPASDPSLGFAYQMTSAGGDADGLIEQGCYQSYYGAPIVQPAQQYYLRIKLTASGTAAAIGLFVCDIYSPSQGQLAFATVAATSITSGWYSALMNAAMPASIPADAIVRLYLNYVTSGTIITIDEFSLINAQQPVLNTQMIASYAGNPFGYNQITGAIGYDTTESLVGCFEQRGTLYPLSDKSLFQAQNNGTTEPYLWPTSKYADECGCASPCAVTWGSAVAAWAGQNGAQMFYGSPPKKITQDIQQVWDTINWNEPTSLWMQNDAISRIMYIGIPTGASTYANLVLPMNYRSVDSTYNVPDPFHVGLAGKLIATELVRKWSIWNVQAACGAMVTRNLGSGPKRYMLFGAGAYGNLYYLNASKFTDDDFGVIGGGTGNYWASSPFWNHDTEQQTPLLGLFRKIYVYLSMFVTGTGNIKITPLVDNLSNAWPSLPLYPLVTNLGFDYEWPLNVLGNRVFFRIQAVPLEGETDAAFNLQHMVVAARQDKVFPVRGALNG